jgi:hypothetical protein
MTKWNFAPIAPSRHTTAAMPRCSSTSAHARRHIQKKEETVGTRVAVRATMDTRQPSSKSCIQLDAATVHAATHSARTD